MNYFVYKDPHNSTKYVVLRVRPSPYEAKYLAMVQGVAGWVWVDKQGYRFPNRRAALAALYDTEVSGEG